MKGISRSMIFLSAPLSDAGLAAAPDKGFPPLGQMPGYLADPPARFVYEQATFKQQKPGEDAPGTAASSSSSAETTSFQPPHEQDR